jgi:hypothetical protein
MGDSSVKVSFLQLTLRCGFSCPGPAHLHLITIDYYVTMHGMAFLHSRHVVIFPFCFCICSSPLKVKEDDDVDKLEIKINTPKRSKRTSSPEVAMKISRSLRVSIVSLHAERHIYTHMCLHFSCR